MDRARNSDSETPLKRSDWTSTTDFSCKTLCVIFLGHPVPAFDHPLVEQDDVGDHAKPMNLTIIDVISK